MLSVIKLSLCIFIMLTIIPHGLSIKCWTCHSTHDPKCADPFDNSTLPISDCSRTQDLSEFSGARPNVCRKIRQKVNNEWQYIRGCAVSEFDTQSDEKVCFTKTESSNIIIEHCSCNNKDGCNSSYMFEPLPLLLVTLLALPSSLFKLFVW